MILHTRGLQELPGGRLLRPLPDEGREAGRALRRTFNVKGDDVVVHFSAAYDLKHFDKDGWVITRQRPQNHEPTEDRPETDRGLGRDAVRRDEGGVRDRHLRRRRTAPRHLRTRRISR